MNVAYKNPIFNILTEFQRNFLHSNIITALYYNISATTMISKFCLKIIGSIPLTEQNQDLGQRFFNVEMLSTYLLNLQKRIVEMNTFSNVSTSFVQCKIYYYLL